LSASDRQAIETAMEAVKAANEGTDPAAVQRALDQLTAAQHKAPRRSTATAQASGRRAAIRIVGRLRAAADARGGGPRAM